MLLGRLDGFVEGRKPAARKGELLLVSPCSYAIAGRRIEEIEVLVEVGHGRL